MLLLKFRALLFLFPLGLLSFAVELFDSGLQLNRLVPVEAEVYWTKVERDLRLRYEFDEKSYLSSNEVRVSSLPSVAIENLEKLETGDRLTVWVDPSAPSIAMVHRVFLDPEKTLSFFILLVLGLGGLAVATTPARTTPPPPTPSSRGVTLHPLFRRGHIDFFAGLALPPAAALIALTTLYFSISDLLDQSVILILIGSSCASFFLFRFGLRTMVQNNRLRSLQIDLTQISSSLLRFTLEAEPYEGSEVREVIARLDRPARSKTSEASPEVTRVLRSLDDPPHLYFFAFPNSGDPSQKPLRLQVLVRLALPGSGKITDEVLVHRQLSLPDPAIEKSLQELQASDSTSPQNEDERARE